MTVDLDTGINRAARREDYCTKSTAIAPAEPGTPCPMWLQFLNKVTTNDAALISFLQRWLGYCLTGYVHEHVLTFLWGTGANGKGVFTSTVMGIFNDYAIIAPMAMFLESKFERHETEIARLKGVRLVVANETQQGRRWDEAKIKTLTGGDKLTGRFMRCDYFDFKPTHKLMIVGNYKPSLRNVDEAVRRRILLVPFTVRIPESERDPKFAEKLKAEWPAILRWMIDGYLEWQRIGLAVPGAVREATDEYLSDQDSLGQWIDDCVLPDKEAFTLTKTLFASWKGWCEHRNLKAGTERAFGDSLVDRGYGRDRTKKARGFNGISLRNSDTSDDSPTGLPPLETSLWGEG
jgi:putative DNA primase/helicase